MLNTTKGIIAATLFAALGATSTAVAQDLLVQEDGLRSIEVSHADLNLESAQGQRSIEARIRSAAKRVCGYSTHRVSARETVDVRSCVNGASENALTLLASNSTDRVVVAVRIEGDDRRR